MARISLDKKKYYPYTPDSELGKKNPVTYYIRHVDSKKSRQYGKRALIKIREQGAGFASEIWQGVQHDQFIENCSHIDNYEYQGRSITPAEAYDDADPDELIEVIKAMQEMGKLTRSQIKNLKGGSDTQSSSEKTKTLPPSIVQSAQNETETSETAETGEASQTQQ